MVWQAVASIGSSLLGGLFGKSGEEKKNETNIKLARETNAFNAEQAQKQMDFQERMSGSAHQREIADLKAAGLNPILSGTGGAGSSTPGGASASGVTAQVGNTMSEMANSARDIGSKIMQNPVINQQVKNMQAENERIQEQTKQLQISNAQQGVLTPIYMEAGNAVNAGVTKVKDLLGLGDEGDLIQGVLDGAKNAGSSLLTGDISIPNSAFDVSRLVGSKDSEARKWASGEKTLIQSIRDSMKSGGDSNSAKKLTSEMLREYGLRQLHKRSNKGRNEL